MAIISSGSLSLGLGLKVEKFAEEVEGARHLLVKALCRVLRHLVINLQQQHSISGNI